MKKLWSNTDKKLNNIVDKYCFNEGALLDNFLVAFDVYGSIAHAKMLVKIGIITKNEFKKLKASLIEIINLHKKGDFTITEEDEDVHIKVESYLTEKLGDSGKKIHTGRSRNDQVLVDLRLFAKEQLLNLSQTTIKTALEFVKYGQKYEFIPMPGYTHMQKAMPSSIGMWLGSFAEQLLDQVEILKTIYKLNDQSPLGSGAAYGVSLPIDRELTAKNLGFSKVQNNSLYCQISRATIQLSIIQLLVQFMLCACRFAQDLLLFTTNEFNFFDIEESICTGSSIMPQKKNLDLMEYVRAKTHTIIANQQMMASLVTGLTSGYNADFGQTKGPFIESFFLTDQTLKVLILTLKSIKPNYVNLIKSCTPEIYTTHLAYQYVKKGYPFRDAYLKVKQSLDKLPKFDSVLFLKESKHTGGTANLNLPSVKKQLQNNGKEWQLINKNYSEIISSLIS